MEAINIFFNSVYSFIKTFSIADFIDIALISYIVYKAIKIIRETRAGQLVKGILLLTVSYFFAIQFGLKTVSFLLKNLFQIGIIALIILFQPELRRVLEKVGRTNVSALNLIISDNTEKKSQVWERAIQNICTAVDNLSKTKTGALIVIEQKTKLGEQIDTGVMLNADITVELLLNIFFVNTPLHDGAVIIRNGKVLAAACFLPKPQKEDFIESKLGSRHRAAIGISEISDAITIVVSEETGTISITTEGRIIRHFTKDTLQTYLINELVSSRDEDETAKRRVLRRIKK